MSIYIAVDTPDQQSALSLLQQFTGEEIHVKIGMELFYQEGAPFIERLVDQGYPVFLDVKCHDIPVTVYRTMKGLARLGVDMVNVHAAGGTSMMRAALEGLEDGSTAGKSRPKLLAVTQLTSTTTEQMNTEQRIHGEVEDSVLHYTKLAYETGLDGVVCSARECVAIRQIVPVHFRTVTPGIRLLNGNVHDQQRIVTPRQAKVFGASHLVVGRPITEAEDPLEMYRVVKREWEEVSYVN